MNDTVITSIVALVGTLIGTFGGILTSSKLTAFRLEQLEKKVEKHNSVIDRTYRIESRESVFDERLRSIDQRLDKLEKEGA